MVELWEIGLLLIGWTLGMLVDWFVMMPRAGRMARKQNVEWLLSDEANQLWDRVAERVMQRVEEKLTERIDGGMKTIAGALGEDLAVVRQEIMGYLGKAGGVIRRAKAGAEKFLTEQATALGAEIDEATTPQQALLMELATLPEDPSKGPVYNAGIRFARKLASGEIAGSLRGGSGSQSGGPVA